MSPNQIDCAIATALGNKHCCDCEVPNLHRAEDWCIQCHRKTAPDYSTSLDAMSEAEASLMDEEFARYKQELDWSIFDGGSSTLYWRRMVSATALQRATAWAKTKGIHHE